MTRTLLCLPPAGGVQTAFAGWPAELGGYAVAPVRVPRGQPDAPTSMAGHVGEIVLRYSEVIAAGGYAVLGHSVGAQVALHLVATIAELDLPAPERLIAVAARPPGHPDPEAPLHRLPDHRLAARIAGYGGMPAEQLADPELLALALTLVRTDLRLAELASPVAGPLPVPISAIGGRRDESVPVELLAHWSACTDREFAWESVSGGHFFFDADLAALWRAIAAALQHKSPTLAGDQP